MLNCVTTIYLLKKLCQHILSFICFLTDSMVDCKSHSRNKVDVQYGYIFCIHNGVSAEVYGNLDDPCPTKSLTQENPLASTNMWIVLQYHQWLFPGFAKTSHPFHNACCYVKVYVLEFIFLPPRRATRNPHVSILDESYISLICLYPKRFIRRNAMTKYYD